MPSAYPTHTNLQVLHPLFSEICSTVQISFSPEPTAILLRSECLQLVGKSQFNPSNVLVNRVWQLQEQPAACFSLAIVHACPYGQAAFAKLCVPDVVISDPSILESTVQPTELEWTAGMGGCCTVPRCPPTRPVGPPSGTTSL